MRFTLLLSLFLLITACSNGTTSKKNITTIAIFGFESTEVPPWDPDSIKNGIPGSEEAVIYMSQELAKMGYQVTVFANPPKNSKHKGPNANPRFLSADRYSGEKFDVAISWRLYDFSQVLKSLAKQIYLWPHDVLTYDISDTDISNYNDVFWLSESQRKQWISRCPKFQKFANLYGNGIDPQQFEPIANRQNPYSCIYGSNYARGLEILLQVWPLIKQQFPLATLDIYYGWKTYGLLSPTQEARMKGQIRDLASLGVTEHGCVGHEELNQAYAKASFWTYPCILEETFCITALRAQYSGAIPVIVDGSALTETVRFGYRCHEPNKYLATILQAMSDVKAIPLSQRNAMREFIDKDYTWRAIAEKWERQFIMDYKENND